MLRARWRVARSLATILPVMATTAIAACFIVNSPGIHRVAKALPADSVRVTSPVRAHLLDGSTVTYPAGVELVHGMLRGKGQHYDLTLRESGYAMSIPLDSVLGMESYSSGINGGATVGYSILATGATIGASIAIFGSCPTFYSDSAGTFRLEAEGFSYSIAPLFEARDVDRLRAGVASDGSVRLEVRNEAYETHYINQLELLEVRHDAAELVVPDPGGRALAVRDLRPPIRAIDRAGRDVRGSLSRMDGQVTHTDRAILAGASERDLEDFIDITLPVPRGADSVALVLRLRNSLLNTVLLYDVMLGDRGARALDWLGKTTQQLVPALELAKWYANSMGIRVLAVEGDSLRELAHLRDTGPVAWKDLGVIFAAPHADSLRLRLAFVADNWRIDRVALGAARHPSVQAYGLTDVIGADDHRDSTALAALTAPDSRYLQTMPGQRFTAIWRPDALRPGEARTFLLASQGYYIEWIRRAWLAAPRDTMPFRPSRATLAGALARWRVEQDSLETGFYRTRVPVR